MYGTRHKSVEGYGSLGRILENIIIFKEVDFLKPRLYTNLMFVTLVVLGPLVRHRQADAVVAQLLSVVHLEMNYIYVL